LQDFGFPLGARARGRNTGEGLGSSEGVGSGEGGTMSARMRNPILSICAFGLAATVWQPAAWAETVPAKGSVDARIRTAAYDSNEVYRLHGFVGYQIDLEFEPGETFVGLGSGD